MQIRKCDVCNRVETSDDEMTSASNIRSVIQFEHNGIEFQLYVAFGKSPKPGLQDICYKCAHKAYEKHIRDIVNVAKELEKGAISEPTPTI